MSYGGGGGGTILGGGGGGGIDAEMNKIFVHYKLIFFQTESKFIKGFK